MDFHLFAAGHFSFTICLALSIVQNETQTKLINSKVIDDPLRNKQSPRFLWKLTLFLLTKIVYILELEKSLYNYFQRTSLLLQIYHFIFYLQILFAIFNFWRQHFQLLIFNSRSPEGAKCE
jgi:hypothetical protein